MVKVRKPAGNLLPVCAIWKLGLEKKLMETSGLIVVKVTEMGNVEPLKKTLTGRIIRFTSRESTRYAKSI